QTKLLYINVMRITGNFRYFSWQKHTKAWRKGNIEIFFENSSNLTFRKVSFRLLVSDDLKMAKTHQIVETVFYSLMILIGGIGNILVIIFFALKSKKKELNSYHFIIAQLAVSDL
uniref:G-protein coupled receptors family 1 profile domain-containing protein n=1 Tax=Clytia hemisphaerica TaxID=252671 RepID=A0A7M5XDA2_9CNID